MNAPRIASVHDKRQKKEATSWTGCKTAFHQYEVLRGSPVGDSESLCTALFPQLQFWRLHLLVSVLTLVSYIHEYQMCHFLSHGDPDAVVEAR